VAVLFATFLLVAAFPVEAAVAVKGYFRKDGTYVSPHYRSNPDGNPYNNWSYPGNTNPYTGKTATGNPDTYLNNYYGGSSYLGGSTGSSLGSSYVSNYKSVYGGYRSYGILFCGSGYYEQNDSCLKAPPNSTAYGGYSFYCNSGYSKSGNVCIKNSPTYATASVSSYAVTNCPQNSHQSLSDVTSCVCDSGYQVNATKTACVPTPVNASAGTDEISQNNKTCTQSFGEFSLWAGTKNTGGGLNCTCQSSYIWNAQKTSCVVAYNQPSKVDYKSMGENYYQTNRTCIGLTGDSYSYCMSYAFNR
jgi:hypothetical protein